MNPQSNSNTTPSSSRKGSAGSPKGAHAAPSTADATQAMSPQGDGFIPATSGSAGAQRNAQAARTARMANGSAGAQNSAVKPLVGAQTSGGSKNPSGKPPLSRNKKILITVLSVIVALLAIAGVALALYVNHINDLLTKGDKTPEEIEAINEALVEHVNYDEPFYMLLIGSDARPWESMTGTRSDVNIVARIDPKQGLVTLISIPRDTKITIEGHGTCKFNAAYAYGGAAGAIKAANKLLDIQIAHYAEVDFSKLMDLIDAIGGVDVDVDVIINDRNADLDSSVEHIVIEKGMQHLSGKEALVYARSRAFADGDFTRTSHQRTLITAIINKFFAIPVNELPNAITSAAQCVTTDMTVQDLLNLATQFQQHKELTVYSAMIPSTTAMIGGVSYVINDEAATKEMMKLVSEGKDPSVVNPTSTPQSFVQDGNVSVPDVPDSSYGYQAPSNSNSSSNNNTNNNSSGTTNNSTGGTDNSQGDGNTNTGTTNPDEGNTGNTGNEGNEGNEGDNPGTTPPTNPGGSEGETPGGSAGEIPGVSGGDSGNTNPSGPTGGGNEGGGSTPDASPSGSEGGSAAA